MNGINSKYIKSIYVTLSSMSMRDSKGTLNSPTQHVVQFSGATVQSGTGFVMADHMRHAFARRPLSEDSLIDYGAESDDGCEKSKVATSETQPQQAQATTAAFEDNATVTACSGSDTNLATQRG